LSGEEERILGEKLSDKGQRATIYERYRIIGCLRGGMPAPAAARAVGCSGGKAEHWLHRFNGSGFATFEKSPGRTGRPVIVDSQQVRALIRAALSRPEDLGLPFTQWSVSKLRAYCLQEGLIPPITDEWVRRLLRREGVSYQHTKTWKQSPDPEFEAKKTPSSTSTSAVRRAGRSSASTSAGRSN
jgi:transposase